jgi:hypothetical protein
MTVIMDVGENKSSMRKSLEGALILPVAPRKGFTQLQENSRLKSSIAVVVVFAVLYSFASMYPGGVLRERSYESNALLFTFKLAHSLLYFVVLTALSTVFIRGAASDIAIKYSSNANLIAYWFAWRFLVSSILVLSFSSLSISGENIVYLIVSFGMFLWLFIVFVVGLSVANSVPIWRCWGLGFLALFLTSFSLALIG